MTSPPVFATLPFAGPGWAFEMKADPWRWLEKSKELNRAALLLFRHVRRDHEIVERFFDAHKSNLDVPHPCYTPAVLDQYVLLVAFSLENVLKGLYVRAHPESIGNGHLKRGLLTSHNLVAIADDLNIQIDRQERQFLDFVAGAAVSWGRYPVARSMGNDFEYRTVNTSMNEIYESLFTRLGEDLARSPVQIPQTSTGHDR